MAIRTYKVTLDSKNTIAPEPVYLRQGDKTGAVVIDATLMDNGAPVSLDGLTPMFKANTADGKAVIADSTGFSIVNASGGEFTYQVPNALSSVPGKIVTAYFSFSDTSGSESTFDVAFVIKAAVDITQQQASDYITIIDSFGVKGSFENIDALTAAYPKGDIGFYVTLNDQHLHFWDKSESKWSDIGGFTFGLPQMQDSDRYARDQKNFFKNADLLIPNQTDPYLPLTDNVDVNYIAPIDGYSWVQVIGHDDDTPLKGVRVESKINDYPERFWIPTNLRFILRNDDVGDSLFHVDMVINQTNGGQIVKRIADFIGSNSVNTEVKVTAESPLSAGAQQGNISSLYYQISSQNLRHVKFRVTGITGSLQLHKTIIKPDEQLAKNNLLGKTDVKQGPDVTAPYVSLTPSETLSVETDVLDHNWVTASGTDNQTAFKGVGIDFYANTDSCYGYDKKFIGLARTASATNNKYYLSIIYNTSNGQVLKTLDTNITLTAGIAKLEYTIPSPQSLGISRSSLNSGRIQLSSPLATDFSLSVTEWSLKTDYLNDGKTFKDDNAIFTGDNNFKGSAWVASGLTKSTELLNNKLTTFFAAKGVEQYRNALLPLIISEDQKYSNLEATVELVNGDQASQQFMILARYDYVTADAGVKSIIVPIKKSVAAPLKEWIKVSKIMIPSAFSQGVPANVATTINLLVTIGNESDQSVAFWIGNSHVKLLAENNVSLLANPLASSWAPKDMTKYPSVVGNLVGYQFNGNNDSATWRGAYLNYGVRDDDAYSSDSLLDFAFKPLVQKINKLLLTAEYFWTDANGNRKMLQHELLHYADATPFQLNKFSSIRIPSPKSMGVPNEYTSNPIVSIIVNTNNQDDSDLKFFVGGENLRLSTGSDSPTTDANNITLPTIRLNGNFDAMTKENAITMPFQFNDHGRTIKGYSSTNWQGDSSLGFPKKNLRLKLYTDEALSTKLNIKPDPRFPKGNKFDLKANYIQTFSARNLVTAELLKEVVSSRQSITPYVAGLNNYGAIVGFPVLLYINDDFYGLMTLNTTKDIVTKNLSSKNPLSFAVEGNNGTDANMFKASTGTIDPDDSTFDFSLLGKDAVTPEIQVSLNTLLKFVNESTDADFVAHINEHYDVDSAIDWLLMVDAAQLFDEQAKNIIHLTEDGTKFYAMLYDLDGSFANGWQGSDKLDPTISYIPNTNSKLLNRIGANFKDKIKARYNELVSLGIFTTNNIQQLLKTFITGVGEANYELDKNRWPSNPANSLFSYDETMDIVRQRMNVIKNDVTNL